MNTTGFKFVSNEAKKLTKLAFNLSTKMIQTCFRIQFNVAVFPLYFIYGGVKYVYQSYSSDCEIEQLEEPSSETIVNAVKRLRNSVVSGMNGISSSRLNTETNSTTSKNSSVDVQQSGSEQQSGSSDSADFNLEISALRHSNRDPKVRFLGVNEFSGGDLMWDVPVLCEKAKCFSGCLKEKEPMLTVSRKALEEHPIKSKMPNTRLEYEQILTKARNGLESISLVSENGSGFRSINVVDSNFNENIKSTQTIKIYSEGEESKDIPLDASNQRCQNLETQCKCDFSTQYMAIRRDMQSLGKTVGKTRETCNTLLEQLINLNVHLKTIIEMREQLNELELQVEEGKRLYEEVEQDRTMLKSKLADLEKLISEEEKYFSDFSSYESGFYEGERAEPLVNNGLSGAV